MSIRVLDGITVSQIAAGEVVAGPASVVKELVENSMDAGASRISIRLSAGGRSLVEVVDDGRGMSSADVLLAIERHATSKISTVEDLDGVGTFGFRGEALPSIASVSRMEIVSREAGADGGFKVTVEGGETREGSPWAHPPGTTVRVSDLFFNTPARAAQLRSPGAELGRVLRAVSALALSRPDVGITVEQAGRVLLSTTGSGDLRVAYMELFGRERARDMVDVGPATGSGISVGGLVGRPSLAGGSRVHQHVLVNGRPVRVPAILRALTDALRAQVGDRGHVPAVLVVDVEPGRVDINVHPAKSEVRFSDDGVVYRVVRQAVEGSVETVPKMPCRPDHAVSERPSGYAAQEEIAGSQESLLPPEATRRPPAVLGCLFGTFIVAVEGDRAFLVDQHAAHERVVYEALIEGLGGGGVPSQSLIEPERLDLAPADCEFFCEHVDLLENLGFRASPFGGGSIIVRGVPAGSSARELRDLIDVLQEDRGDQMPAGQRAALHLAACRSSVMAGQRLTENEMSSLLARLSASSEPGSCPHGRPTTVELRREEVERWFRRR